MRSTYLTRKDADCGVGLFDSIKWALEKFNLNDDKIFNFALLHGNEDSPVKIEFWKEEPKINSIPDFIIHANK